MLRSYHGMLWHVVPSFPPTNIFEADFSLQGLLPVLLFAIFFNSPNPVACSL